MNEVIVNEANLKNNHIYLNEIYSIFPAEAIGGNNASSKGKELEIRYICDGKTKKFMTDIAGDKKIFRKRGKLSGTGMLLSDLDVKAGDILKFKKIDKYVFEICVVV
ncbi:MULTISPECIES: hypothetical protein [unclassified Acinetobacter]|uniref:hypothetical protein n=1 Tax=unclassified Acinetobacter TaxID=196816 RepID=UPI0007D0B4F2|nr:hypothetical protein [Acinetobacter sp. SFA]OAL78282.1 hypothetical protein AY607_07355 [Acinetobacter sp. SFA]